MATKKELLSRHAAVLELIAQYEIEDQETLAHMLLEKHCIQANQSVISRDLRQLGIIKKLINNRMLYELPQQNTESEMLKIAVTAVNHNETLIVLKTREGLASFVAEYLDKQANKTILATLAGENTVLVVPFSSKTIKTTYTTVRSLVGFKAT
ncbi:hypothetical protein H0X48_00675 [Candidatus Dependentiae bacterium]|nr:hypothetical protein [Candidatus Dependentiae bacterium]